MNKITIEELKDLDTRFGFNKITEDADQIDLELIKNVELYYENGSVLLIANNSYNSLSELFANAENAKHYDRDLIHKLNENQALEIVEAGDGGLTNNDFETLFGFTYKFGEIPLLGTQGYRENVEKVTTHGLLQNIVSAKAYFGIQVLRAFNRWGGASHDQIGWILKKT